ncbi:GntR family transcriptional regulator [Chitinispirillales bacterium ANBcel5]|uniref:GntR family transcriptional regulator n=1 Tax=Cellulosispirillum alkaliphilum TaxID=3039283 RepID=UPI002A541C49|nr:GntR family transcriptional regulator [Chitinispirillales bacterium ANBcel5]
MAFTFTLSNSSGVPYYRQIVNQVMYAVANGMLKPGERLPTVRQLAVDLQVNLNTIVKAYGELEIRGVVNTQQGTGTFVSECGTQIDPKEKQKGIERLCFQFLDEIAAMSVSTDEVITTLKRIIKERTKNRKGDI